MKEIYMYLLDHQKLEAIEKAFKIEPEDVLAEFMDEFFDTYVSRHYVGRDYDEYEKALQEVKGVLA